MEIITIQLKQQNQKLILTKDQFEKIPNLVPLNRWKIIKVSNYEYVGCSSYGKIYFLHNFVFNYDSRWERIIFPDSPLNFSTAYISGKSRSELSKQTISYNGCLITKSTRSGKRCEYSWHCKNYDSCLTMICETSAVGWESNGEGFMVNESILDIIKEDLKRYGKNNYY